jgi:uncharacterized protein (DUF433 family)
MKSKNSKKPALMREMVSGEPYEYYPLGKHIVAAPGVCGGRPTFKYTRVEVAGIVRLLGAGWTVEKIVAEYNRPELNPAAIEEAARLAAEALVVQSPKWKAKAA